MARTDRADGSDGGTCAGIPVFHWLLMSKFYELCGADAALAGLVLGQFRRISGQPLPISEILCIWIVKPSRHDPDGEMVGKNRAHNCFLVLLCGETALVWLIYFIFYKSGLWEIWTIAPCWCSRPLPATAASRKPLWRWASASRPCRSASRRWRTPAA